MYVTSYRFTINGNFGYSHISAIVINATMNVRVQKSLQGAQFFYLDIYLVERFLGYVVILFLIVLGTSIVIFFISTSRYFWAPHPYLNLLSLVFLIKIILTRMS
jgi:hypothetical protein